MGTVGRQCFHHDRKVLMDSHSIHWFSGVLRGDGPPEGLKRSWFESFLKIQALWNAFVWGPWTFIHQYKENIHAFIQQMYPALETLKFLNFIRKPKFSPFISFMNLYVWILPTHILSHLGWQWTHFIPFSHLWEVSLRIVQKNNKKTKTAQQPQNLSHNLICGLSTL